jgi:hypothetical protein
MWTPLLLPPEREIYFLTWRNILPLFRPLYGRILRAVVWYDADKTVQIDGLPNCGTESTIFMDLWTGQVGLF